MVADTGAYTQACDVWSIGVITYMLLSGTPPFKGDTDMAVLQAVRCDKGAVSCLLRQYSGGGCMLRLCSLEQRRFQLPAFLQIGRHGGC